MESTWDDVISVAQRRRLRRQHNTLSEWDDTLDRMKAKRARLQMEGLWYHGRPDLLRIIGRGRREIYHSQMLAWLLDPGTPSGLEHRFLVEFLRRLDESFGELEVEELYRAQVACEVVGAESRTDLLIRGETFTVAIEVKVDAGEGKEQLARMYRDYEPSPDPRFVFLTPGASPPRTHGDVPIETFHLMGFREVRDCLRTVLDALGALDTPPASLFESGRPEGGIATCLAYLSTLEREFI